MSSSVLSINRLDVGYHASGKNSHAVCQNLNLKAEKGELVALIGSNGVGKSTLLRSIAGLQKALKGEILFSGKPQNQYSRNEFAQIVSFVSTEIVHVNNLCVGDLVALGRFPYTNWFGVLKPDDRRRVLKALEMVRMKEFYHKMISEISDGERQRAMIARTLAQDTSVIILDEPTAFLDLANKYEIVRILNQLAKEQKKTIVFSSHDLNIAIREADKIWLMLPGSVVEGAPEDLILQNAFEKVFDNPGLIFDRSSGDFKAVRNARRRVSLRGEGNGLLWTQKALERLGYKVSNGKKTESEIEVKKHNGKYVWFVEKNSQKQSFDSIYALSHFLNR